LACLGSNDFKRLASAKVLVVGAGGIGCELLKNLVLSGFSDIEVIDLDTIDLSNLNRQFLFRYKHIGMSKSKVARESVLRFNPKCSIVAHHGNIKDSKFDSKYFEKFDIVLNALDNLSARQHVNRLCLATKRALVESGTQGFFGQVNPIIFGDSACFECDPPPAKKTYAVCTIRSTPDKPVHCVVWAKHIFALLFGPKDKENMLSDLAISLDAANETNETNNHNNQTNQTNHSNQTNHINHINHNDKSNESNENSATARDSKEKDSDTSFEKVAFRKFFCDEIKKVLSEGKDWNSRPPPKPLDIDQILKNQHNEQPSQSASLSSRAERDQRVLTLRDQTMHFLSTTRRFITERKQDIGFAEFDKDDELVMDFVAAVANLRMHIYAIPMQTRFAIKGIAGNIVHAVATTNAIAAGLVVVKAIQYLVSTKPLTSQSTCTSKPTPTSSSQCTSKPTPTSASQCTPSSNPEFKAIRKATPTNTLNNPKITNSWIRTRGPMWVQNQSLEAPKQNCAVCGNAQMAITVEKTKFTLGHLYNMLRTRMGMIDPSIDNLSGAYFGSLEDNDEHLIGKLLIDCPKMQNGVHLSIEDQMQDFDFSLIVSFDSLDEEKAPEGYVLTNAHAVEKSKEEQKRASVKRALEDAERAKAAKKARVVHELV